MTKTTIATGEVNATALIFQSPFRADHTYVVLPERIDTLEFWQRYGHDARQVTDVLNADGWEKNWYLLYVADCFDPPVAIIRADSFETAYEMFLDDLPWAHITDPSDLADYDEETLYYNGNGVPCDTEAVQGNEITLLTIEVSR